MGTVINRKKGGENSTFYPRYTIGFLRGEFSEVSPQKESLVKGIPLKLQKPPLFYGFKYTLWALVHDVYPDYIPLEDVLYIDRKKH